MKRMPTQLTLLVIVLLGGFVRLMAQVSYPKYEFGASAGFLVYQGDLTPHRLGSIETQKLSLNLHASRILSASFSVRANFLWGKLKGDDGIYNNPGYRQQRNFNFTSPVKELSGQLVWSPTHSNYRDKGISPYLFAGAGVSFLHIKRDWSQISTAYFNPESSDIWGRLAADSAHSLPRILPVVPLGAGVKYFITQRWGVNAEASYRLSYSDYLDGFSQAANPDKNDHYLNYAIGIIYRTGKKNMLDCPVLRY